jgi:hypothetical protein
LKDDKALDARMGAEIEVSAFDGCKLRRHRTALEFVLLGYGKRKSVHFPHTRRHPMAGIESDRARRAEGTDRYGEMHNYEGGIVRDERGGTIGKISRVLVDRETHDAAWLEIALESDESMVRLVPYSSVKPVDEGYQIIGLTRDKVMGSPHVSGGELDPDAQAPLRSHYTMSDEPSGRRTCITLAEAEARGGAVPGPAVGNVIPTSVSEPQIEPICEDDADQQRERRSA